MKTRSLQEWVHWLEMGAGGRWVTRLAIILGVILLSLRIGYTQFHGPLSETTLAQAVVARQLADGEGFTTLVNYPQTVAWLKKRARETDGGRPYEFDQNKPLPELHQPPLYPLAMAAALRVFPEGARSGLFNTVPEPPNGFRADYVLLVLNIGLLWLAAWQTFALGRMLFDESVGAVAMFGLLLSSAIWAETIALGGTPLMMVLLLSFFRSLVFLDERAEKGRAFYGVIARSGAVAALLFLADYAAGVALAVGLVWAWMRVPRERRVAALAVMAGVFFLVAGPWIARNIALTGNPVALAWHGIALKAGDPTAEPVTVRASLSADAPEIELRKVGNKLLTSVQTSMRDRLWAGGGLVFTAFFVTGLVYRFRGDTINRARWLFVGLLASLVVAQAIFDSGEGERLPVVYATPLIVVFGAGFFSVLVASSDGLRMHARWAALVLLAIQAIPLARDVSEPRRQYHFNYPPYFPGLFLGMRETVAQRGGVHPAWLADVPAGAAWYSGQRVWAQPATLRDFYGVCVEQPQIALVLTSHTLDRPFFGELIKHNEADGELGDWSGVYRGLVTRIFPEGFPLTLPQRVADNFYVLVDPLRMSGSRRSE